MRHKSMVKKIFTILLLMPILPHVLGPQVTKLVRANTQWTVDDDGPADFTKIQNAINHAISGDTIFVRNGTYYENIVVHKTLSLIGEDRNATIIDGNRTGTVVHVTANDVCFQGFTIQNGGREGHLFDTTGIILFRNTQGAEISDNNVMNCEVGIYFYVSTGNYVHDNHVSNNSFYGILMDYSDWPSNIISNNVVVNCGFGIGLDYSQGHNVSDNAITNCSWYGIYLFWGSDDNMITGNRIFESMMGIYLQNTFGNTLKNNMVLYNTWCGICLDSSDSSDIRGNTVKCNSEGIFLKSNSTANTITSNLIGSNHVGIHLRSSENNVVFHNNFVNNSIMIEGSYSWKNLWDDGYPSGGNYWTDYAGLDECSGVFQNETGSDWIGDTPYVIDENNRDNYPLIDSYVPERQKTRVAYRNLLGRYNEVLSNFNSLNSTCHTLQSNYSKLQGNYTSLQIRYNSLQGLYDSLNSTYTSVMGELNNIRSLMYVFMVITVIFVISTVYLATRTKELKVKT